MDRKICLDTDILIQIMRNDKKLKEKINSLNASFYTTSINIFEIWQGHKKGEETLELLEALIKLNFDESSAFFAGDLQRKLSDKGTLIDFRDLFIGATCIKNNVELMALNSKHFLRLKQFGLKLI